MYDFRRRKKDERVSFCSRVRLSVYLHKPVLDLRDARRDLARADIIRRRGTVQLGIQPVKLFFKLRLLLFQPFEPCCGTARIGGFLFVAQVYLAVALSCGRGL